MRLALAGLSVLAAAATLTAFLGLAKTFSCWRWTALSPPPAAPARVPAVPVEEEPIVTAMTASDVDSLPSRLEPRPRPFVPAEREEETPLGSLKPKAGKSPAKKPVRRRPVFKTLRALAGSKPRLVMQEGADFDGGSSEFEAYSEAGGAVPAARGEAPQTPYQQAPAPAPKRRLRSVTGRSSARPGPAQTSAPEPAYEEDPEPEEE